MFKGAARVKHQWRLCKEQLYSRPGVVERLYPDLSSRVRGVMKAYFESTGNSHSSRLDYALLNHNIVASQIVRVKHQTQDGYDVVLIKMLMDRNEEERARHRVLIRNEYDTLKRLYGMGPSTDCSVIRPLALMEDHLALISQYVDGKRFDDLFLEDAFLSFGKSLERYERSFYHVGKWLSFLADFTTSAGDAWPYLERKAERARTLASEVFSEKGEYRHFLAHLSMLLDRIQPGSFRLSMCHGDFIPSNFILSGDRIFVTDFSDQHEGVVQEDVAKCYQWMESYRDRRPWVKEDEIDLLQSSFLKGFLGKSDSNDPVLMLFRILDMLENLRSLRARSLARRLATRSTMLFEKRKKRLTNLIDSLTEAL